MGWNQGTTADSGYVAGSYVHGSSLQVLMNTYTAVNTDVYAVQLSSMSYRSLSNVVIVTSVSQYPGVGDGFNRFRGVAPGCNYAMVRIPVDDINAAGFENALSAGIDLLVLHRLEKNIKIISISSRLVDDNGRPAQSTSVRDKVTSAVNSGVMVVVAAGNEADNSTEAMRAMADPARAALAMTVGASNDKNALTEYSTYGYTNPSPQASEDFKPDVIAPGGSWYYTGLIMPDSGSSDGSASDQEPNDYAVAMGTSFSAPMVSGSAALVIQAMERQGGQWDFTSSQCPRYVKMLLCATASETNANREVNSFDPTLQRSAAGPNGFPAGKDPYEGYGLINPDAAVEAVSLVYAMGSVTGDTFGSSPGDRRVWARSINLRLGFDVTVTLGNPAAGDFDLYLYSSTPSGTGTPVILASSTNAGNGIGETFQYSPVADVKASLVVKQVAGSGAFTISSVQAGPPTACDVHAIAGPNSPATVTLAAVDDGLPNPPGGLVYTIASLPQHGRLEQIDGNGVISSVPAFLGAGFQQVAYRSDANWVGSDSFTYYADDGGTPPVAGRSNTATVFVSVAQEVTVKCQVSASGDDVHVMIGSTTQKVNEPVLGLGISSAGMRFTRVDVPRGSHVVRATLKIRSFLFALNYVFTATIRAEATSDAASLADRPLYNLNMGTASQSWALTSPPWVADTWYSSPDITNVIQEVISRPGWSAGNSLVIVCFGSTSAGSDRRFWSFDGNPNNAPQLEITYQP